jgi:hypothetical protein
MENRDRVLSRVAREQHGVFTMAQARAVGLTDRAVNHRIARGVFERLHAGVFGYAGSGTSWDRDVIAAVFSTPHPSAASHRTAAYLWGLSSHRPDLVEVATVRHRRVHRDLFTMHESKDLLSGDIHIVDGIPTTAPARTIVDLGASSPPWFVEKCLDTGLRKRLFTVWEVQRFIVRVARPGRTGVGIARPLVEQRLTWQGITESDLEDLFRRVVASTPFPMPDTQHKLHTADGDFVGRYDFAYPSRWSIIETDSEGFHMDPVAFQRDRDKQNQAQMLGWMVYRVTWRQLIDDPDSVRAIVATIWTD